MSRFAPLPAVQPRSASYIAPSSRRGLAALRRSFGLGSSALTFGIPQIDALTDGFARGALHEIIGEQAAVSGFLAALLGRDRRRAQILWVTAGGSLHAPTLGQLGLDHRRLTVVSTPRVSDRCAAAEQAMSPLGYGAVVAEIEYADSEIAQRLQDAASRHSAIAFLVRQDRPQPSLAATRWSVQSASSDGFRPCWQVTLEAFDGSAVHGAWLVEWDHSTGSFRLVA
ncbi:hypothetical protein FNB15_07605 [Ferrovibrio terrae]|uniref:Protein ImuA n=1 Tax=Ferrovibrio terrae TaxID=2594003 RepID=A0A516H059_9PROT|nr:hypothetical protein [Ferrovibrio terrae]QDO97145.1 hypothetical protein FNB15_07605 [Ferrovibrio terrae]